MKNVVAFVALLCAPLGALAADGNLPSNLQASTQLVSPTSWMAERGTMTTDDVVAALGIALTAEQRAQIEKSVQERNARLRAANLEFSQSLQKVLSVNDEQLAKSVAEEKERQRLAKIRSRQPGRYNGMRKKNK